MHTRRRSAAPVKRKQRFGPPLAYGDDDEDAADTPKPKAASDIIRRICVVKSRQNPHVAATPIKEALRAGEIYDVIDIETVNTCSGSRQSWSLKGVEDTPLKRAFSCTDLGRFTVDDDGGLNRQDRGDMIKLSRVVEEESKNVVGSDNTIEKTPDADNLNPDAKTFESPHQRDVCNRSFTCKGGLKQRRQLRTRAKPHGCHACDKSFPTKLRLQIHARTHTKEKPFLCQKCGRSFSQIGNLNSHIKTHDDLRWRWPCDLCGKALYSKRTLENHRYTHDRKSRVYRCRGCDQMFSTARGLGRHVKVHSASTSRV